MASAIVILMSLLAILSPGFRSLVAHPATAGWAAAIATSVAAGVALYVSTSTISAFRMQQRDREEIEISVHALVAPELSMALVTLGKYPGLVEQLEIALGYENQRSAQAELEVFPETLQMPMARDSIETLHYLSAGKGRNVAYAVGLVPAWRDKVHMLTQYSPRHAVWPMLKRQSDVLTGRLAILLLEFFGEDPDSDYYVHLRSCVQAAREDQLEAIKLIQR